MRLHVVDGTYELFRSHFGPPQRFAPDGRPVGAVVGLLASLLKLLRDEDISHAAVATDREIRSFRNDLFAGYKDGAAIDPVLLEQFSLAERAIAALGLVGWHMVEFEADDALATAAIRYRDAFEQIILVTADKDVSQCVDDARVVVLDRSKGTLLDEDGVRQRYGVSPASVPDYLALAGDAADGIPGLPGWGAKSAAAVLARYGHLETIPADAGAWDVEVRGAAKLATTLQERRDAAFLYRELATLRTDVPLAESASALAWRGVPREPFLAFCDEVGAGGLRTRPHRWAP
ncbi:MAG: 5'-3' exonuclease H3TH domain-containing protein [Dehalococcoidia bacterium]